MTKQKQQQYKLKLNAKRQAATVCWSANFCMQQQQQQKECRLLRAAWATISRVVAHQQSLSRQEM